MKSDKNYRKIVRNFKAIYREYNLLKSGIDDPDEYFEKINNY